MTTAKTLRLALLGGAAIIATTAAAKADDLATLKAQLATLQTQVSALQTANASALPAGTSLVTMRKGSANVWEPSTKAADATNSNLGYTFAIAPTADMPAPTTEVTVTGEVRSFVTHSDLKLWVAGAPAALLPGCANGNPKKCQFTNTTTTNPNVSAYRTDISNWDITERARVKIAGKTETSVGEVGAVVRMQATDGGDFSANKAYGYWKMSPEWTLMGGRDDSASAVQAGVDWMFSGAPNLTYGGTTNDNVDQVRLTYASGPLTAAVAIEDNYTNADHNAPQVAGFVTYEQGGMLFNVAALMGQDDIGNDTDYFVGAGANVPVGSMLTLTASVGTGEGGLDSFGNHTYFDFDTTDTSYDVASVGAMVALTETTSAEIGYGYTSIDNTVQGSVEKANNLTAQILWSPVKQLTLGANVGYQTWDQVDINDSTSETTAGVGAWFKF